MMPEVLKYSDSDFKINHLLNFIQIVFHGIIQRIAFISFFFLFFF